MVGVPAGGAVELDLRLESVVDGVLVSGSVTAPVAGECGRCLEPFSSAETVDVQELFAYDADDDETPALEGDFIDAEPLVRDAIVLGLPLTPLCDADCPGLCATCGVRLADVDPDHAHDEHDPRWAALAGLIPDDTNQES
jgi:uncharacterized protein